MYTQHPICRWTGAIDPDRYDTVAYDFRASTDSQFAIVLAIDSLTDTTVVDSIALEIGRRYWWKIISRDNHGATSTSDVSRFRVYLPGDVDKNWSVSSADIVSMVNFVFKGGSFAAPQCAGDVNKDGSVTSADIISLVNYVFKGGVEPIPGCG